MSSANPSIHCDCRAKSIRNVVIVSLVVACVATALQWTVFFKGHPVADAVCGILIGLAMITGSVAHLHVRDRRFGWPVYANFMAGVLVAGYWCVRLFLL